MHLWNHSMYMIGIADKQITLSEPNLAKMQILLLSKMTCCTCASVLRHGGWGLMLRHPFKSSGREERDHVPASPRFAESIVARQIKLLLSASCDMSPAASTSLSLLKLRRDSLGRHSRSGPQLERTAPISSYLTVMIQPSRSLEL